jgi:pSer/pThr/pTyr-binding forkhead associated (FHA) protein
MWKLTIEDEEGKKTLLPLVRDEYLVGRDAGNTIRLTERNISRKHATLKKNGGGAWHLVDNTSYNGCYVNGQRVAGEAKLANSDLIQVGDYRIFISTDAVEVEAEPDSTGTPETVPAISLAPEKPNRIVQLAGPEPGKEVPLAPEVSTIGRAEECTVSINHPSVSRVHAEIRALGAGRYEVLDRGSSNGVRVNGIDLRRALLEGGDLIELGDVKLRFLEKGQPTRGGTEISQQIAAVTSQPAHSARPPSPAAAGKRWAIVAAGAVAIIGVVAFVALRGGSDKADAPTASQSGDDAGAKALEAAKKLAAASDFEGAIAKLATISDASPAKKDPQFAAIFGKWADATMKRAGDSSDAAEKRSLYTKVAQSSNVDADRRKQAAEALAKLDTGGTAIDALPAAATTDKQAAAAPPTPPAGTGDTAAGGGSPAAATTIDLDVPGKPLAAKKDPKDPAGAATKDPKDPKDKPTADKGDPKTAPTGEVLQSDAETKMRKQLEGRVWGGKATPDEIKMLRAICKHQNDRACADRAGQMLNK